MSLVDFVRLAECEYFAHWTRLIDLESREGEDTVREIWTIPSAERELLGKCVPQLILKCLW